MGKPVFMVYVQVQQWGCTTTELEGLYYGCSENKGADLCLCFGICRFSQDVAHLIMKHKMYSLITPVSN